MAGQKRPWLSALLALVFGPLGFLYFDWRFAVMGVLAVALFTLPLTVLGGSIPMWMKYPFAFLFAYKAFIYTKALNADRISGRDANYPGKWVMALVANTDIFVGMAVILTAVIGLWTATEKFQDGLVLRGVLSLVGTPILVVLVQMVFGTIAKLIDAAAIRAADSWRRSKRPA